MEALRNENGVVIEDAHDQEHENNNIPRNNGRPVNNDNLPNPNNSDNNVIQNPTGVPPPGLGYDQSWENLMSGSLPNIPNMPNRMAQSLGATPMNRGGVGGRGVEGFLDANALVNSIQDLILEQRRETEHTRQQLTETLRLQAEMHRSLIGILKNQDQNSSENSSQNIQSQSQPQQSHENNIPPQTSNFMYPPPPIRPNFRDERPVNSFVNLNDTSLVCKNVPKFNRQNEHMPLRFINDFEAYCYAKNVPKNLYVDLLITAVQVDDLGWSRRCYSVYSYERMNGIFIDCFWS
ncbi:hypothetical protein U1Q18_048397 [Sarracenia purpurea var. burkii]